MSDGEKFETRRREEVVSIDGRRHVLRELTAKARFLFLDESESREAAKEKGVDLSGKPCPEAFLLALGLFDEAGVQVKAEVLDTWPSSLVADLAVRVAVLSGLGGRKGNG